MRLHNGDYTLDCPVLANPGGGARFHRLELNYDDLASLSRLGSEQLAQWFVLIQSRVRPPL